MLPTIFRFYTAKICKKIFKGFEKFILQNRFFII